MVCPQDCKPALPWCTDKRFGGGRGVRENQHGVRKLVSCLEAVIKEFIPKVMMETTVTFSLGSGASVLKYSSSVTLPLNAVSVPGGMERRTVFL